jgi:hypothetical protein
MDTILYKGVTALNAKETAISLLLWAIPYIFEPAKQERFKEFKQLISDLPETQKLASTIEKSVKNRGYLEIDDFSQELIAVSNMIYDKSGLHDFIMQTNNKNVKNAVSVKSSVPDFSKRGKGIRLDRNNAAYNENTNIWQCQYTAYSDWGCYIAVVPGTLTADKTQATVNTGFNPLTYLISPMNVSKFLNGISSWSGQKKYWSDTWNLFTEEDYGFDDMTWDKSKLDKIYLKQLKRILLSL